MIYYPGGARSKIINSLTEYAVAAVTASEVCYKQCQHVTLDHHPCHLAEGGYERLHDWLRVVMKGYMTG